MVVTPNVPGTTNKSNINRKGGNEMNTPIVYLSGAMSGECLEEVENFKREVRSKAKFLAVDPGEYSKELTSTTPYNDRYIIECSDAVLCCIRKEHGFRAGTLRELEHASHWGVLVYIYTDNETAENHWVIDGAEYISDSLDSILEVIKLNSLNVKDRYISLPPMVSFQGNACAGKSWYKNAFKQKYGSKYTIIEISMAEYLKETVANLLNTGKGDPELLELSKEHYDPRDSKNRAVLQNVATKMKEKNSLVFVYKLLEKINHYITAYGRASNPLVFVIDDIRYPFEIAGLSQDVNPIPIFIDVPLEVRQERHKKLYGKPMTKKQLNHDSEAYVDDLRIASTIIPGVLSDSEEVADLIDTLIQEELRRV